MFFFGGGGGGGGGANKVRYGRCASGVYLASMLHGGNKTKTRCFAKAFGLSLKNNRHI